MSSLPHMTLLQALREHKLLYEQIEPRVLAFLSEDGRFERLEREARRLSTRFPESDGRPPLYGTLVGVKDMIRVGGFPTLAGSRLPGHLFSGTQAPCVTRLKEAGALLVGKTTTSEFAYRAPTATLNPHDPAHTPGGSSAGSAAAVAAGLCPLALGTQTTGSLIKPAAFCGVAGFKPSYDRVSRQGIVPLAPSLDHVGLFGAQVSILVEAAALICDGWRQPDSPLHQPVLGVPAGPYLAPVQPSARRHFDRVCERLVGEGYGVLSVPAMPGFKDLVDRHNLLLAAEAARIHQRWSATYSELYEPQTIALIRRGQGAHAPALESARAGREAFRTELTNLMDAHGLDLWLSPATPGPAPRGLAGTGSSIMNLPWTYSGLPVVNLPSGKARNGLPLGLQVSGRWYADEELLAWCAMLEQAVSLEPIQSVAGTSQNLEVPCSSSVG